MKRFGLDKYVYNTETHLAYAFIQRNLPCIQGMIYRNARTNHISDIFDSQCIVMLKDFDQTVKAIIVYQVHPILLDEVVKEVCFAVQLVVVLVTKSLRLRTR